MTRSTDRAEFILYATPSGPLAATLDDVFARLAAEGPTTAQAYPPHCTLTGFFHREPSAAPRLIAELAAARGGDPQPPTGEVEIVALHHRPDWIGFELRSPWLQQLTERFVERHVSRPDDDPLRPKDWLHLSIAYGEGDLRRAAELTRPFDLSLPVKWDVDLWQRHDDGAWSRLRD